MDVTGKKIGIWGFGILGKSALNYLLPSGAQLEVIDSKELPETDRTLLDQQRVPYSLQADSLASFLERNDIIIPSSGIDLRNYAHYKHKWLPELDFFQTHWQKPVIAITGTVGKTSTTQILGQLLVAHNMQAVVGGNIGVGLFDLLNSTKADTAVIEVSSFQLELSTLFAPDLAIWTNFFPNHLDRHSSQQEYFDAKYKIIAHQKEHQQALVPMALQKTLTTTHTCKNKLSFFTLTPPTQAELNSLTPDQQLFYSAPEHIMLFSNGVHQPIISWHKVPAVSFKENWLILCSALHMLNIPMQVIHTASSNLCLPEHRLEKLITKSTIDFYNDSKSTTIEATLAALHQLPQKPLHLFLGGLGKGIDRSPLIAALPKHVKHVYCFGKEAETLHALCSKRAIESSCWKTLEEAFEHCCKLVQEHEQVLFSPAGASYDLFAHYAQRGSRFKELVDLFAR